MENRRQHPSPEPQERPEGKRGWGMPDDTEIDKPLEPASLGERKRSWSMIVQRDHLDIEIANEEFLPGDARAMSPRRSPEDLEWLGRKAREALNEQTRNLRSPLAALSKRIDAVKSDHDKLERENKFLRDHIGGLTGTVSTGGLSPNSDARRRWEIVAFLLAYISSSSDRSISHHPHTSILLAWPRCKLHQLSDEITIQPTLNEIQSTFQDVTRDITKPITLVLAGDSIDITCME